MQELTCPKCGNPIEYWDTQIEGAAVDGVIVLHWECPNCHILGHDEFELNFSSREIDCDNFNSK